MARPLRINYENAVYHVMNRGKGRSTVFHNEKFAFAFLKCLEEAHVRFGLEILAYCLMNNHYHLLVRTPRANLSRCMRHIDGVYTQRYNKLLKTDSPLFRGRYKAILVDADSYLLQVSRYIHQNPINTTKPLVTALIDYVLSSYPAYINVIKPPYWLNCHFVLSAQNVRHQHKAYKNYVENNSDDELKKIYNQKKLPTILGGDAFVKKIKRKISYPDNEISPPQYLNPVNIEKILTTVSNYFNLPIAQITTSSRGAGKKNVARRIAMYFLQQHSDIKLAEIATHFNVRYSTVSKTIARLLEEKEKNASLRKIIDVLSQDLTP